MTAIKDQFRLIPDRRILVARGWEAEGPLPPGIDSLEDALERMRLEQGASFSSKPDVAISPGDFVVIIFTIFRGKKGDIPSDIPWSETLTAPGTGAWSVRMDKIAFWSVVAIVLVIIAYGPFFGSYLPPNFVSPGFTVW